MIPKVFLPIPYKSLLFVLVAFIVGNGCQTSSNSKSREADNPAPSPPLASQRPGKVAFKNSLGMKFVPVPQTKVLFCIWETRGQDYAAFASTNSGLDKSWISPRSSGRSVTPHPTCPVVNVSWTNAKAFCSWLTDKEHQQKKIAPNQFYRLPTDEEWSYAVGLPAEQGKTPREKDSQIKGVYPWGTTWPPPKGAGNYSPDTKSDRSWATSPVGSYKPNQYGIYDLGGNVWEWCEDWLDENHQYVVCRGASWDLCAQSRLLSSYRGFASPDFMLDHYGFRIVLAEK